MKHFAKFFKTEDSVSVFVKLGEDGVDLFPVEFLGDLLELFLGDEAVVVLFFSVVLKPEAKYVV